MSVTNNPFWQLHLLTVPTAGNVVFAHAGQVQVGKGRHRCSTGYVRRPTGNLYTSNLQKQQQQYSVTE